MKILDIYDPTKTYKYIVNFINSIGLIMPLFFFIFE